MTDKNKDKEQQIDELTIKLATQRIANMTTTTTEDVDTLRKIAKELQP